MEEKDKKRKITDLTLRRMREGRRLVARYGWNYAMLGRKWDVTRERARKIVIIGGPIRKFQEVQAVVDLENEEIND